MKLLKQILPQNIYKFLFEFYNKLNPYYTKSYSQEGEDLILKRFFENKQTGFYIDVGAYHPIRFSNTYYFYKMGWSGINIEARPGSKKFFDRIRKRDINIEAAISDEGRELVYYKFNEPALNGFSKEISFERNKLSNYKIIDEIKITTLPLSEVLKKYLPEKIKVNFMSIDVEGLDLNVLKSNDWNICRPTYILVEDLNFDVMFPEKSEIFNFMKGKGYNLVAKTYNTLFFKEKI